MFLLSSSGGFLLNPAPQVPPERSDGSLKEMYSGTLINDLFAIVERAHAGARAQSAESQANVCHCTNESSESEQFPQSLRLSPADWNLGLLLVVHAQLVRALEPRDDFADAVDVYQVGAVRPPKKIRV